MNDRTRPQDGYEIALRQRRGPARRSFRVVPLYADLATRGNGIAVELDGRADVQSAADELANAGRVFVDGLIAVTQRGVVVRRDVDCSPARAMGLCQFGSLHLRDSGLPHADIVVGDPLRLVQVEAGPLGEAALRPPGMLLRTYLTFIVNRLEPPDWLVELLVRDGRG